MTKTAAIIARSKRTRLVLWEAESDFTLVTFAAMRPLQDNDFWASSFSKKSGIRTISFVPEQAHWYPQNEMCELIDEARAALEGHRAVSFGYSMGGYGALKYSSVLGVDAVLAFSPQNNIDPSATGDPRFTSNFVEVDHSQMGIEVSDLANKCVIVADKRVKWDNRAAEEIAGVAPQKVRYLPVVHSGHASIGLMLQTSIASSVFDAMTAPLEQLAGKITPLLTKRKKDVSGYFISLSLQAFRMGRVALARQIIKIGLERTQNKVLHLYMANYTLRDDPLGSIRYIEENGLQLSNKGMLLISRAHRQMGNEELANELKEKALRAKGRAIQSN